jgi:glycosyltransferase involved in cell wall biosynthesis
LFKYATKIIACSKAVAKNIIENHGVSAQKIEVIHSFVDNESILNRFERTDKQFIKKKYNLPETGFLIGGCGNAEWRKGIDVFLQVINQIMNTSNENCHFVWIGVKKEGDYYEQILYDIAKMGNGDKITFIEQTPDAVELINCLDIFTIVSREDPFPLVMLEAALAQKTMIGFDKTGGCSEFIEEDAGIIVPYLNTFSMASSITKLFLNQSYAKQLGQKAKDKVLKKYSFENSVMKIESLLGSVPKI